MVTKKATSKKTTTSSRQTVAATVASGKSTKGAVASSMKKATVKKAVQKAVQKKSSARSKPQAVAPQPKPKSPASSRKSPAVAVLPVKAPKVVAAVGPGDVVRAKAQEPTSASPYFVPHESIDPGILGNDDVHDETDYAQWMQLVEQAEIAKRAREMSRTIVDPNFDGVHCVDCDCEIPAKRIEYGFDRCVDCKQMIEDEQARQKRLAG